LKNYAIGLMGNLDMPAHLGFVFQNFIYKLLYEKYVTTNVQIKFWRTTDQAEVDFILENGNEITPVEVKYSHFQKPEITRSLRNFCEQYHPKEAIIINLNLKEEVRIGKTKVLFKPFRELV
jgi:predicted AAA+ superfamily ATPase